MSQVRHEVPYPFVRKSYESHEYVDGEERTEIREGWAPGARNDDRPEGQGNPNVQYEADGMGAQLVTELASFTNEAGRPMVAVRIKWRDPEGRVFGKKGIQVISRSKLERTLAGYMGGVDIFDSEGHPLDVRRDAGGDNARP